MTTIGSLHFPINTSFIICKFVQAQIDYSPAEHFLTFSSIHGDSR